jgi:hypothetical protein
MRVPAGEIDLMVGLATGLDKPFGYIVDYKGAPPANARKPSVFRNR